MHQFSNPKCAIAQMLKCSNLQMHKKSNAQMLNCTHIAIQCLNVNGQFVVVMHVDSVFLSLLTGTTNSWRTLVCLRWLRRALTTCFTCPLLMQSATLLWHPRHQAVNVVCTIIRMFVCTREQRIDRVCCFRVVSTALWCILTAQTVALVRLFQVFCLRSTL